MEVGLISRRYATALWSYAVNHKQEDMVYSESLVMSDSYTRYPTLKRVLSNRTLSNGKKVEILLTLEGALCSDEFKRFIELVVQNNREEFLQEICLSYQEIYRKNKQILHVEIVTAREMDDDTQQTLLRRAELLTGQTVHLTAKTNPAIIGGYVVRWDTFRLDASSASKLNRIQQQIKDVFNTNR